MPEPILASLAQMEHEIQTIPACSELMGHASAIAATADAVIDIATEPRSDGAELTATGN